MSGVEAFNANWATARSHAERGDSAALWALQREAASIDGAVHLTQHKPTPSGAPSKMDDGGSVTYEMAASISSSETWPLLESSGLSHIGSYVLFVGDQATTNAEYKIIPRSNPSGGEWASAGSNSSGSRLINTDQNCAQAANVGECLNLRQQDVTFDLGGVPSCGVNLAARGNHEAWFTLPQWSFGFFGVSVTIHVGSTDVHATRADVGSTSQGSDCAPPPDDGCGPLQTVISHPATFGIASASSPFGARRQDCAPPGGGTIGGTGGTPIGNGTYICVTTIYGEYDSDTYEILWWDEYETCWWVEQRMSGALPRTNDKSDAAAKIKVTMLGTAGLPGGVHTLIQQSDQGPGKIVVAVDTTTASEAEVDAALTSAALFDKLSTKQAPNVAPRLLLNSVPTDRLRSTSYHQELKDGNVKKIKGIGTGMVTEVEIEVPKALFSKHKK